MKPRVVKMARLSPLRPWVVVWGFGGCHKLHFVTWRAAMYFAEGMGA